MKRMIFFISMIVILSGCGKENNPPLSPSLPTPEDNASGISTSISISWDCSDPDGDPLVYDIYFGTSSNATIIVSADQSAKTYSLTGLTNSTDYYWKIVAKDNNGNTTIGEVWRFTTQSTTSGGIETGTFTDTRDGKVYATVKIGNQWWFAENLAYLPVINPSGFGSVSEPFYYVYGYEGNSVSDAKATTNYSKYGVLYNWPAAMAGEASSSANPSGVKGICPTGWHLPSDDEWKQLETVLGMAQSQVILTNSWRGTDQGTQLKATSGWVNGGNGTNSSGFSALPGGELNGYNNFMGAEYSCWQTSTQNGNDSWRRTLYPDKQGVHRYSTWKNCGYYIRCVKD